MSGTKQQPAKRARGQRIPGEEYLVQRPGSSTWQVAFSIGSRRFRFSSGTSDKATAAGLAAARWQEEWNRIKLGIERPGEMTLNDGFLRYYNEVSKGTSWGDRNQRLMMQVMLELMGPRTLFSELDDGRVNDLLQALRYRPLVDAKGISRPRTQPLAPGTINRYIAVLRVVCKRAKKIWKVNVGDWNATDHTLAEPQGREVFLDHEQARRLVVEAVPHLRAVLLVALTTGMRRGNVLLLQWEHVSLDMGRAVLVQKGHRRLGVTLPPMAVDLLRSIQPDEAKRKGSVFVFGNPAIGCECTSCVAPAKIGKPITSVRRSFLTAAAAAGVRDMPAGRLRFHDLRHTFASWLLAAPGGSLKLVQDCLGHAQIATTARYTHLLSGGKEAAIDKRKVG